MDEKSNEITALPQPLDQLDIQEHIINIDSMACQKKIAPKITFAGADYLLVLKANHPNFHKRLEAFFNSPTQPRYAKKQGQTLSSVDVENQAHGRKERRIVLATDSLE